MVGRVCQGHCASRQARRARPARRTKNGERITRATHTAGDRETPMQRSVETMSGNTVSAKPKSAGRGRKLLYFAYGAEMLSSRIRSRCASPKVVATARLADHCLGFYGYSPIWDGGLETVLPAPGREVWGVVYELCFTDADSLDTWQGVRLNGTGSYFHTPAEVVDAKGAAYAVLVYKKNVLGEPSVPSRPYLDAILAGACEQALPAQK